MNKDETFGSLCLKSKSIQKCFTIQVQGSIPLTVLTPIHHFRVVPCPSDQS